MSRHFIRIKAIQSSSQRPKFSLPIGLTYTKDQDFYVRILTAFEGFLPDPAGSNLKELFWSYKKS